MITKTIAIEANLDKFRRTESKEVPHATPSKTLSCGTGLQRLKYNNSAMLEAPRTAFVFSVWGNAPNAVNNGVSGEKMSHTAAASTTETKANLRKHTHTHTNMKYTTHLLSNFAFHTGLVQKRWDAATRLNCSCLKLFSLSLWFLELQ